MPEVTREQREAWRREAGLGICTDGRREFGRDYRILDLLNALEATKAEWDEWKRDALLARELAADRQVVVARLRGVEALAEEWERGYNSPKASSWSKVHAKRLRAVLAAETEETSGEAGR